MISANPAGISEADWQATPTAVRAFILVQQAELQAQQQEIEQLRSQLSALASELASLRERIGRSSRNSSRPPSSEGLVQAARASQGQWPQAWRPAGSPWCRA